MGERVTSYRDLKVWQRAIDLVPEVYELLRSFPKHETYALADQIRRAVVSIPANIAEGQARQHRKEFLQSLYVARGSLAELETLLVVAEKLSYLGAEATAPVLAAMTELRRMLSGLISRLHGRTGT